MHSLRSWNLFKIDLSIQHCDMPGVQCWHLLGGWILCLLRGVHSWHIRQWGGSLLTLLFGHLLGCRGRIDKRYVQVVLSGLLFSVVMATDFLHNVR